MPVGRFLGGIAALIYHPASETYLVMRRAGHRDYLPGSWECVTGRVDQGEGFEEALHREVMEETSAQVQIDFVIDTSHFYRGEPSTETELLAVRYACTIADRESVVIEAEHTEMHWMTAEEIYELVPPTYWLHEIVRSAEIIRTQLTPDLAAFYRKQFRP